mgnify:FL=1
MSRLHRHPPWLLTPLVGGLIVSLAAASFADEPPTFDVPAGSVTQLLEFIKASKARRPDNTARDAVVRFLTAQQRAIVAASDKILAARPDAASELAAHEERLAALWTLITLGAPDAQAKAVRAAEALQNDARTSLARRAQFFLIWNRWQQATSAGMNKLPNREAIEIVAAVQRQLETPGVDELLVTLASTLPEKLERSHPQLARQAASGFSEALAGGDDPRTRRTSTHLADVAKRLQLFERRIELEGPLVGGGTLDWADFRGNVVFIDFWATWCEPCVAEIPHMTAAYEKFRDRGFRVIGISLDDDTAKLAEFVNEREIPWPVVNQPAATAGMRHPLAIEFGVDAVPRTFLIDRQGKLVRLDLHGAELLREIEVLLKEG